MKCFWGHNFGKWRETDRGKILISATKAVIGDFVNQERRCKDCNYIQTNRQSTHI